jgi:branched-chain amino acid transport system substrate-binding protein
MKTRYTRSPSWSAIALAATAALGLALTACSSSSSSSSATSPATTASGGGTATTAAPGGTVATGTPINIDMPNLQGSTQGVNLSEASAAAQAAVDWINHNGGVQGHPLKLTVCHLLTTPASDVSCANSMAAANPAAVVAGGVDNAQPIVTALAAANVPYVTAVASSAIETSSPDAFAFTAGNTGAYYVVGKNEAAHGGKQVALVLIGAQGAAAAVAQEAAPTFKLAGVGVKVILTSPTGQSDLTPTIQAATGGNVSGVFMDEDPTTCIAGLNAKATLGVSSSIRFYADASCESQTVVKGAGANAAGTYFTAPGAISDQSDPDWSTYSSAMNQYAPGVTHYGFSPNGYIGVMDLYRAMKTIPSGTAVTAASVKAALQHATAVKAFLGAGTTFTCDGKQVPQQPSVCSGAFFLEQYSGGTFKYIGYQTLPASS